MNDPLKGYTPYDLSLDKERIVDTPYRDLWLAALRVLTSISLTTLVRDLDKADVRFSTTLSPTACIDIHKRQIFFNPKFLRERLTTANRVAAILLHELMHPIVDYDNRFPAGILTNIATDFIINGSINKMSRILGNAFLETHESSDEQSMIDSMPEDIPLEAKKELAAFYLSHGEFTRAWLSKGHTDDFKKPEYIIGYNKWERLVWDSDEKEVKTISIPNNLKVKVEKNHLELYHQAFPENDDYRSDHTFPDIETVLISLFGPTWLQQQEEMKKSRVVIIVVGSNGQEKSRTTINPGQQGEPSQDEGQNEPGTITIYVGEDSSLGGTTPLTEEELKNLPSDVKKAIEEAKKTFAGNKEDSPEEKQESPAGQGQDPSNSKSAGLGGTPTKFVTKLPTAEQLAAKLKDPRHKKRQAKTFLTKLNPKIRDRVFGSNKEQGGMAKTVADLMALNVGSDTVDAFLDASESDVRGTILNELGIKRTSSKTVIPYSATRSGVAILGSGEGFIPSFWKRKRKSQDSLARKSTLVYVDVSGSMDSYIPWVLSLVIKMKDQCNSSIMLFSTIVAETNIESLQKGEYISTGGTDFDCVVEHFLTRPESKCLIITDGWASLNQKYKKMFTPTFEKSCYGLLLNSDTDKYMSDWCKKIYKKEIKF